MIRVYYKHATACLIIFDVTTKATFDAVDSWKEDLDSKVRLPSGDPVPCLLIGNKCDLPNRQVTREQIEQKVKDFGW